MVELFPSLIPDKKEDDTYTKSELEEWDWSTELRRIAAELSTDKIDGRSTQLEVVHYLSGRFTTDQLDEMRRQINSDDPDFDQIPNTETTLNSFNGSDN